MLDDGMQARGRRRRIAFVPLLVWVSLGALLQWKRQVWSGPGAVLLVWASLGALLPLPAAVTAQPVDCEVADADIALRPVEEEMLALVNGYRLELNLPPLLVSPTLERAARWKAGALAAGGPRDLTLADHDDPYRTWDRRILDCGYPDDADFAENLGASNDTLARQYQAWRYSPAHDANMSDPRWSYAGIAAASTPDGFAFWVTTFGTVP
jgi:uncharacterized protein YkwD